MKTLFFKLSREQWEKDRQIREALLEECIMMESLIDKVTCNHFFPDGNKRMEFERQCYNVITPRLRDKIRVLQGIIKDNYPEIQRKFPNLVRELDTIVNTRNKLAHESDVSSNPLFQKFVTGRLKMDTGGIISSDITLREGEIEKEFGEIEFVLLVLYLHQWDMYQNPDVPTN